MSPAAHATHRELADDLSDLLAELDPALFQIEAADAARSALTRIRTDVDSLNAQHAKPGATKGDLSAVLAALQRALPDPSSILSPDDFAALHREVWPIYERLAEALHSEGEVAKPVRPDNKLRSVVHMAIGVSVALAYETLLTPWLATGLALGWAGWAWGLEGARRASPRVNALCMRAFGPIAREHERNHVNSATWFGTGILIASVLWAPLPGIMALLAAAVGDPSAGFVGRRWGRTRLYLGRSLEGSLAFAVVAFTVGVAWAWVFHREEGLTACLVAPAAAAVAGAVVEHLSSTVDDNLAILIASGGAATFALWLV